MAPIEAHDRAVLERLLRYCARSPFAMDRLRKEGAAPLCHISPVLGPPLWDEGGDAQMGEAVQIEPDRDLAEQPALEYEVDQRISCDGAFSQRTGSTGGKSRVCTAFEACSWA